MHIQYVHLVNNGYLNEGSIRQIVDELLVSERRISSFPIFHFNEDPKSVNAKCNNG